SALGGIGPDAAAAFPELLQAVHDTDASTRCSAVSVLGLIAPTTAVPVLRQALSDPNAEVRQCARAALLASSGPDEEIVLDKGVDNTRVQKNGVPTAALKIFQPEDSDSTDSNGGD